MKPLALSHAEVSSIPARSVRASRRWDPRLFQIATLGGLLGYGVLWLGLDVDPWTSAVFLEYAWDMSWCDPCAADPLSPEELRKLGVFWLPETGASGRVRGPAPVDTFVTRLHVRYDATRFPDDLVFQETADRANYQGRYVLRNAFTGDASCEAGRRYRESLRTRAEQEATTLASLTGWPIEDIRRRIGAVGGESSRPDGRKWWRKLFGD